jgi:hypothetical protein
MGKYLFDQYSIFHFMTGFIAYQIKIDLLHIIIISIIFEYIENTESGKYVINKYFTFWPGGKPESDTFVNQVGDTIIDVVGWLIAKRIYSLKKLI